MLPSPHRATRAATLVLLMTFAAMFVVAVERTLRLDAQMEADARVKADEELQRSLRLWEELQLGRIRDAFGDLRVDPEGIALRPPPWAEAVYLWGKEEGGSELLLLAPPAPPSEDIATQLADPCMQAAMARATPELERVAVAEAWLGCRDRAPAVALLAVSRAADQFLAAGEAARALQCLEAVDLPLHPSADLQGALGLSEGRVLTRQLQVALARRALGDEAGARALLVEAGDRIVGAEGPALDQVLPFLEQPILAELEAMGEQEAAALLRAQLPGLLHRRAGYRALLELGRSVGLSAGTPLLQVEGPPDAGDPEAGPAAPLSVVLLGDRQGSVRYLLLAALLADGRGAAIQVSPARLLDELLATLPVGDFRVLDAEGRTLLPAGADDRPVLAQVPFGRLLPELRLATTHLGSQAEERRAWRRSQLLPISLGFIVAAGAFATWVAAGRQQRELWDRQQAFVGRVSHELKTPLAGIKIMAELMEVGIVVEPQEIRQTSQRVITEVRRMEDRVNEILRLARRPEIKTREPLDIRAMAADLQEAWTPRYEQRGARLDAELEATAPVVGDRELVRDAMNNLLDNALKYLREDTDGVVRMRTATSGRWISFEVVDNGLGVPEDMRRAIFERFTRIEGEGRGKAGGHGLGLAFVAEAIGNHGGKVECREGINGGARFIIRLRRS